jgi:holo-[acyl-carrier protein] synthase
MDFGVGVDIASIENFKKYKKDDKFLSSIFTDAELEYCFSKDFPASHLTVRFAAKEAVIKALYSINKKEIDTLKVKYKYIEIFNSDRGVPIARVNNLDLAGFTLKVSLSHNDGYGIAYAVIVEEKA